MIERIKTHNHLNGLRFSMAEFVLIAGVISPFAGYYVLHGRYGYALISVGLIINCLTVAAFSWQQWRTKAPVPPPPSHLLVDTLLLVTTALMPYALFMLVVYEWWMDRAI